MEHHSEIERTITLADMVAYAGATWDWHRLHYDQRYAEAHGMPGPVVDGQMLGALMAMQGTDHVGAERRLVEMSLRLRSPVFAEDAVNLQISPASVSTPSRTRLVHTVLVGDRVAAEGFSEYDDPRSPMGDEEDGA